MEFCGRVTAAELRELYARSRALIVPGEEDFGINMVEALASGKPVIALGRGGAREIVPEEGGVLYENATIADLDAALSKFDDIEHRVRPDQLQRGSQRFSETRFVEEMWGVLAELITPQDWQAGSAEAAAVTGASQFPKVIL